MNYVRFQCPSCRCTLDADAEKVGYRIVCPKCKLPIDIPVCATAAPEDPVPPVAVVVPPRPGVWEERAEGAWWAALAFRKNLPRLALRAALAYLAVLLGVAGAFAIFILVAWLFRSQ